MSLDHDHNTPTPHPLDHDNTTPSSGVRVDGLGFGGSVCVHTNTLARACVHAHMLASEGMKGLGFDSKMRVKGLGSRAPARFRRLSLWAVRALAYAKNRGNAENTCVRGRYWIGFRFGV